MISRRQIYWLLITVAVGMAASRIVSAQRVYEPAMTADGKTRDDWRGRWPSARPAPSATFSSNDRSRWATVRALVDGLPDDKEHKSTYVVGKRDCVKAICSAIAPLAAGDELQAGILSGCGQEVRSRKSDQGIIFEPGWETIDRVLRPKPQVGPYGAPSYWEFYSSKPPLLPTLMAGLYWLLQLLTGWTLTSQYVAVVRTLLLVIHPLAFALYLCLLARLVDRYGTTDWGRFFVMTAACFATLLTPFLNTFNNHTLGTFSVLFALYSAIAIWERRKTARIVWHHYMLAGLFGAFAVTNELPALSFACALGLVVLWCSPLRTMCFFLPPACLVAAAFLGTNYLAVGQLRPAYSEFGGLPPYQRTNLDDNKAASLWYQYEGSHWHKPGPSETPRHGIDWARYWETRSDYVLHLLVGHHGFFSLTPIWLLALGAFFIRRAKPRTGIDMQPSDRTLAAELGLPGLPVWLAPLTLLVSMVVIGFYLMISENYGGFAVGARWLIWLSPLLLLTMLPVADRLAGCRWGRGLALCLLGVSVFSAFYSNWNPWRHPWLFDLLEWVGWIKY